jgi:hypothetical protein
MRINISINERKFGVIADRDMRGGYVFQLLEDEVLKALIAAEGSLKDDEKNERLDIFNTILKSYNINKKLIYDRGWFRLIDDNQVEKNDINESDLKLYCGILEQITNGLSMGYTAEWLHAIRDKLRVLTKGQIRKEAKKELSNRYRELVAKIDYDYDRYNDLLTIKTEEEYIRDIFPSDEYIEEDDCFIYDVYDRDTWSIVYVGNTPYYVTTL